MTKPGTFLRQPIVIFLGSLLVLIGAGMAGARTQGGPPWAQDGGDEVLIEDTEPVQADVEEYSRRSRAIVAPRSSASTTSATGTRSRHSTTW